MVIEQSLLPLFDATQGHRTQQRWQSTFLWRHPYVKVSSLNGAAEAIVISTRMLCEAVNHTQSCIQRSRWAELELLQPVHNELESRVSRPERYVWALWMPLVAHKILWDDFESCIHYLDSSRDTRLRICRLLQASFIKYATMEKYSN